MRIRKHAKVSPLVYATSSGTLLKSNECQLNQSPWDVITFSSSDPYATPQPPNLFQVNGDDSFLGNGSFSDSIGAVECVASMKLSWNHEKDMRDYDAPKWACPDGVAATEGVENGRHDVENTDIKMVEQPGLKNDTQTVLCCKNSDGNQCKKKANDGEALCQQHFTQLNSNNNTTTNNLAQTIAGESDKSAEPRRRLRPKKPSSSSNPDSYYYYSGFGPRWGKKRGQGRVAPDRTNGSNDNDEVNNVEHLEPIREPSPSSQIDNGEFNYVEDEDEDEDEKDDAESGKKRARKPIKARSLKSLM